LLLITLAAYANSIGLGLALDARTIVTEDVRIRSASAENVRLILTTDYWWPRAADRLYRPVTTLSYLFNYSILGNGEAPSGYHWVNLFLHALNVWLAFRLALHLFGRPWPAFAAAALWAVHPITTESVANVAGRADLLATAAVLGALLVYLRLADHGVRSPLVFASLFMIAGLGYFSKESAVILPGVMLLTDLAIGEPSWQRLRSRLAYYAAAMAPLILLLAVRTAVFSGLPWPRTVFLANPLIGAPALLARFAAIRVVGLDLLLLLWPAHLSSDRTYATTTLIWWTDVGAWIALAAIAAILAIAIRRYRRDPIVFWAAGFFSLAILSASNLVLIIGSVMAERFLYLPALGFAVAAVAVVGRVLPKRAGAIALGMVVALCAGQTIVRNSDWQDDLTLATADVATSPRSYGLHERLATALYERDARGNIDRAIQEGRTAWQIQFGAPLEQRVEQTAANLGAYYRLKGDLLGGPSAGEGHVWYERALRILEEGTTISKTRERAYDEAQIAHGKALSGRAAMQDLYFNLGAVHASLGQYREAMDAYLYGRNINPGAGDPYEEIAAVWVAREEWRQAAITLHEQVLIGGLKPETFAKLRQLYEGKLAVGCSVTQVRQSTTVNYTCPAVHDDLCAASADLEKAYEAARQPEAGRLLAGRARQAGCYDRP
jgi:tetratricopeptide (TPR) repeat protein